MLSRIGDKECGYHLVSQRKGVLRQRCTIRLQSWHFFARETTLTDRQSDINNITISLSLFLFLSLSFLSVLVRIDHLPFLVIPRSLLLQALSEIAGHSIYISVFFRWQESFHGYDILREDGTNRVSARSTYLSPLFSPSSSLPPSLSVSLSAALQSSPPFPVAIISVPPTWSRRLVRRSAAIMTSRGGKYAPH